jgi:hypothetical protein
MPHLSLSLSRFATRQGNESNMQRLAYAILFLFAVLAALSGTAHSEVMPDEAFIRELDDADLVFRETLLKDFAPAPIIENRHMNYELAASLDQPRLEIRYAIRTYDPSPREAEVSPENMAEPMFTTTLLNITQQDSDILESAAFAPDSVKNEFNADWGASAVIIPKAEFSGGDFDRCMVVFIYKERAGAFMFYLYNSATQEAAMRGWDGVFYALRFR